MVILNDNTRSTKNIMIAKHLISSFSKISNYFPSTAWKDKYLKSLTNIEHDEPWLTLIACYSVFGDRSAVSPNALNAINEVLGSSRVKNHAVFSELTKVTVEKKLPEIISYREFLKFAYSRENFHLYPDIRAKIASKVKGNRSFEENTNLDLFIEGKSNSGKVVCFIEVKFLSDIAYQTTYNPVRDQIIRNVDCGIDYVLNTENDVVFLNYRTRGHP